MPETEDPINDAERNSQPPECDEMAKTPYTSNEHLLREMEIFPKLESDEAVQQKTPSDPISKEQKAIFLALKIASWTLVATILTPFLYGAYVNLATTYILTIQVIPADSKVSVFTRFGSLVNSDDSGAYMIVSGAYKLKIEHFAYDSKNLYIKINNDRNISINLEPSTQFTHHISNNLRIPLVRIPAGVFTMGSSEHNSIAEDWEIPARHVLISQPFYLGKHEVTEGQWKAVMKEYPPGALKKLDYPVVNVSWYEAEEFIRRLNDLIRELDDKGKEKKWSGFKKYKLPTEAQWEYAARAGNVFGTTSGGLSDYTWWEENSNGVLQPVMKLESNPWGLFDMHGNAAEWVQDWYADYQREKQTLRDPTGPSSSSKGRVYRGGSFRNRLQVCRSSARRSRPPGRKGLSNLGFRVMMIAPADRESNRS